MANEIFYDDIYIAIGCVCLCVSIVHVHAMVTASQIIINDDVKTTFCVTACRIAKYATMKRDSCVHFIALHMSKKMKIKKHKPKYGTIKRQLMSKQLLS